MKALTPKDRLLGMREILPNGCWRPKRYIEPHGYARIMVNGVIQYLHRVSYEVFVGPIPVGKELDHRCRNRWCFNWEHLEPVESRENSLRGEHPLFVLHRARRCKHDHKIEGENILRRNDGRLRCRQCFNERRRKHARVNP